MAVFRASKSTAPAAKQPKSLRRRGAPAAHAVMLATTAAFPLTGCGGDAGAADPIVRADQPARFRAKLVHSTEGNTDATATLDFGGRALRVALPATTTAETVADADLGRIELNPGELQAMRLTADGTPRIFELDLMPE